MGETLYTKSFSKKYIDHGKHGRNRSRTLRCLGFPENCTPWSENLFQKINVLINVSINVQLMLQEKAIQRNTNYDTN